MDLDKLAKLCQKCAQKNPVIVLGSGSSIPHGIRGMQDLATHLVTNVEPSLSTEIDAWNLVADALKNGDHLEGALEKYTLPDSLVVKIVRSTWDFIASDDYRLLTSAVNRTSTFPLRALFAGLFRSTNRNIHVITTNYDRVAEYAADLGGFIHHTGFLPGYIRRSDGAEKLIYKQGKTAAKTVTMWKVHGSLDWFTDVNGGVLSLPMTSDLPTGLTPLIVTPGVSKYQRTHDEPFRSAIQGADGALKSANAIICLGYGFRDNHIHPHLITRCHVDDAPIMVAARQLTPEARDFLKSYAGRHYLALEDHAKGTMLYYPEQPEGVIIEDKKYWELSELNKLIGF